VVAHGVNNPKSSPGLIGLLRDAEESVRARVRIEDLAAYPHFRPWREAFRWFGAKPSEFRPSVEALVRRVLRGQPLPEISSLVDIGTITCLRHLVPVGGHALDDVRNNIALRLASGDEIFIPFGSDVPEHPLPGEVILAEGSSVLTRRWVWRQAVHTLVTPETKNVIFNIDVLREATPDEINGMSYDVESLVQQYCGGEILVDALSAKHPAVRLNSRDQSIRST